MGKHDAEENDVARRVALKQNVVPNLGVWKLLAPLYFHQVCGGMSLFAVDKVPQG